MAPTTQIGATTLVGAEDESVPAEVAPGFDVELVMVVVIGFVVGSWSWSWAWS